MRVYCGVLLTLAAACPLFVVAPIPASDCAAATIIQLLYIQDVSYSYNNDFANMQTTITSLMASLDSKFYRREVAIASFSDKPIWPSGDGNGDYCYRKESSFSTDPQVAVDALGSLTILSGLDWWESQLDAVKHGVLADNLGWERNDWQGGKRVMRVVMLGTDALPHEKGVFPSLPENSPSGCSGEDYPSLTAVKQLLGDNGMTAIFVVTPDIDNEWTSLVAGWPSTHVLRLADPITDIVAVIESELEEICDVTTTTTKTTTATTTTTTTTTTTATTTTTTTTTTTATTTTTTTTTVQQTCSLKGGLGTQLCSDICSGHGLECNDAIQTIINTDGLACLHVVTDITGGNPFGASVPRPEYAVGCIFGYGAIALVAPAAGEAVDCSAPAGTVDDHFRACCCV